MARSPAALCRHHRQCRQAGHGPRQLRDPQLIVGNILFPTTTLSLSLFEERISHSPCWCSLVLQEALHWHVHSLMLREKREQEARFPSQCRPRASSWLPRSGLRVLCTPATLPPSLLYLVLSPVGHLPSRVGHAVLLRYYSLPHVLWPRFAHRRRIQAGAVCLWPARLSSIRIHRRPMYTWFFRRTTAGLCSPSMVVNCQLPLTVAPSPPGVSQARRVFFRRHRF